MLIVTDPEQYNSYMYYYEIAPSLIVRAGQNTLTYSSDSVLDTGAIVEVEIGSRLTIGVVTERVKAKPAYEVKPIKNNLALTLPAQLLRTLAWTAEYYHTPLASVLQTALPRGLTKQRRATKKSVLQATRNRTKNVLNTDQTAALEKIRATPSGTILLHGITGSGKTEVYIRAAQDALAAGQSAIILVPEIALTSQLVADFQHHFADIILTHSKQTEAQRHHAWLDVLQSDNPRVVIGPRSALFSPLSSIGLIVIDECHEPSFKQEQAPRYSALRLASTLSHEHRAKLILGSATPNASDYYLAKHANRPIVEMFNLARTDAVKPTIQLIDMTKRTNFTKHRFFSDALIARITSTLAAGDQSLVFHNRRGSAPITLCEECGWQAGCGRCFVPLTLHADQHKLVCHICGMSSPVPTSCPECGSVDILHKGIGTKLIESELMRLFPKARIARFDGDTDTADALDQRYQELYDGEIDIIVGTQVIAKGLDLPHLRTVGVVQADAGLSLPDYTSSERTFQLLSQVIGRVGRSSHETHVIVQSYQPTHPAVHDGIAQDYATFYERTLKLRKASNFPPFTHLLKLVCIYKTEAAAVRNAQKLAAQLRSSVPDIELLGPTPAFYERVRDTYRWQLVLKSPHRQALLDALEYLPLSHWQYELDPLSLL